MAGGDLIEIPMITFANYSLIFCDYERLKCVFKARTEVIKSMLIQLLFYYGILIYRRDHWLARLSSANSETSGDDARAIFTSPLFCKTISDRKDR